MKKLLYLCSVKRKQDDILAALKAARKKSREDEIAAHGKPINYSSVVKSKKAYTRKVKHKKIY